MESQDFPSSRSGWTGVLGNCADAVEANEAEPLPHLIRRCTPAIECLRQRHIFSTLTLWRSHRFDRGDDPAIRSWKVAETGGEGGGG